MCIAALAKTGGFSEQQLRAFYKANGDGGGYVFAEKGKLRLHRHITNEDEYVSLGLSLKDKTNLVTHCRIRTSGYVDQYNAHPFALNKGKAALVHNGSLFEPSDIAKSDTREFVEFADILGFEELITPEVLTKVGNIITTANKLIILYDSGNYKIVNERIGRWRDNDRQWMSNTWYDRGNIDFPLPTVVAFPATTPNGVKV